MDVIENTVIDKRVQQYLIYAIISESAEIIVSMSVQYSHYSLEFSNSVLII